MQTVTQLFKWNLINNSALKLNLCGTNVDWREHYKSNKKCLRGNIYPSNLTTSGMPFLQHLDIDSLYLFQLVFLQESAAHVQGLSKSQQRLWPNHVIYHLAPPLLWLCLLKRWRKNRMDILYFNPINISHIVIRKTVSTCTTTCIIF